MLTVAHDYFTQRGGAERVAAALISLLQPERVVCSLYEPSETFEIAAEVSVKVSFLQRVRAFRRDPRRALPLLPIAWRLFKPITDGILICSSSGWSHFLRATPDVKKIIYCHNPARWLYQPDDFFRDQTLMVKFAASALRPLLLRLDKRAAQTADLYIANSTAVAERVERFYGRKALVIHPPVSLDPHAPQEAVKNLSPGFFLTVGRGRGYKNTDILRDVFAAIPEERLVIVGPDSGADSLTNVQSTGRVTDAQLRWLYANARCLLTVSHEDFGLTPLEANLFGTPALALRAGGFLDSIVEDETGRFIDNLSPETILKAVAQFPRKWDADRIKSHAAGFSPHSFTERLKRAVEGLDTTTKASTQPTDS